MLTCKHYKINDDGTYTSLMKRISSYKYSDAICTQCSRTFSRADADNLNEWIGHINRQVTRTEESPLTKMMDQKTEYLASSLPPETAYVQKETDPIDPEQNPFLNKPHDDMHHMKYK